jgi:outer membrane protein insertion porin family
VNYQETDAGDANIQVYDNRVYGGGVNFGIPISEFNTVFTSINYENTDISGFGSDQIAQFCIEEAELGDCQFDILRLGASFTYDTRNKAILPEKGTLHQVGSELAVPSFGNSIEFYKVNYRAQWFHPLFLDFIFAAKAELGYGNGLFGTDELPFFENFYAGGPRSVRGYEENTLGPRDEFDRPIGGNMKVVGGAEIIFPLPFLEDLESVRVSAFFDAGNVYGDDESLDLGELRYSAGLSGIWISPFGLVSVSIAAPFGDEPGDETQSFQFTFGSNF